MPLHRIDRYTREIIASRPGEVFIFGDNMCRVGHGGQAASARDNPNVIGIPTLWSPARPFTDVDRNNLVVMTRIDAAFDEIRQLLAAGVTVHWPTAGVGTGIANLPTNAPSIFEYIIGRLLEIEND